MNTLHNKNIISTSLMKFIGIEHLYAINTAILYLVNKTITVKFQEITDI